MNRKLSADLIAVMLAGIFLCNPVTAFVDLLPNCIGYLLLCIGLSRLADLDGHMLDAVRRFRILALLGVAQVLASAFAYGVIAKHATNVYELRSYLMLGAFLMTIVQWFLLIPAFRELFCGFEYLADRYTAPTLTCKKRGRTVIGRMSVGTRTFVILSSLMALLPELLAFSSLDGKGENGTPGFNWEWYSSVMLSPTQTVDRYAYVNVIRALCSTVALIAAVIWVVSFLRFMHRVLREWEWLEALDTRYREDVATQTGMLTVRRFSGSFYLLQIAILFAASLRMNHYSILPGFVFALLVGVSVGSLGDHIPSKKPCILACIALGGVSAAQMVVNSAFLRNYLPEASLYQADAYYRYLAVRILDSLEAIFTLILLAVLLKTLSEIVRTHTGVEYEGKDTARISELATEKVHQWFDIRMTVMLVIFSLATITTVLDAIFRLEYPWIWLIAFAFSFAGISLFYSVLHELKTQIGFRYHSDGVNKNI